MEVATSDSNKDKDRLGRLKRNPSKWVRINCVKLKLIILDCYFDCTTDDKLLLRLVHSHQGT